MWDRRMIGVPNCPEKPTISLELPAGWTADAVAPRREAKVGGNCVTYVTVLSAFEAAQLNDSCKRKTKQGGAEVDKLLEAITQEGYFSSWVVIEECTID